MARKAGHWWILLATYCFYFSISNAEVLTASSVAISLSKSLTIDLERGRDFRFGVAAKIVKPESDKKISGSNLWKVSAWFGSSEDGLGDAIGFVDQVLSPGQSGTPYKRSARLTINSVSYSLPTLSKRCRDISYFCVRFGATSSPQLSSGGSLEVRGSPDDSVLTKCVRTPGCTENTNLCMEDGTIYEVGHNWTPHPCKSCTCTAIGIVCTIEECDVDCDVEYRIFTEGVCCPTCPTGCEVDGTPYDIDASWQPDVCTACTCLPSGLANCTTEECLAVSCSGGHQPIPRPDVCCPTCPRDCESNGIVYIHHDEWKQDVCTSCVCNDGATICDVESCPPLDCDVAVQIRAADQCCAECALECEFEGLVRAHGDVWRADVCTTCSCYNGSNSCVEDICLSPPCAFEQRIRKPGECCFVCGEECMENEFVRAHGERWDRDVCVSCECFDGTVECDTETCEPLDCDVTAQIQEEDQCCPECGLDCLFINSVYQHGSAWRPDVCTDCSCDNGTTNCNIQSCSSNVPCEFDQRVTRPGECCPQCAEGCSADGQVYSHRDSWSPDPCTSCACYDGNISCTALECPVPTCGPFTRLETPPGECCSVCVDVPALTLRSNMVKAKFDKKAKLKPDKKNKKSKLTFIPIITFDNLDREVKGSNLWDISVWLSSSEDGLSALTKAKSVLSSEQSDTGLKPNERLNFGPTKVKFKIKKPKCKQDNYLCIRFGLTDNPLAEEATLILERTSVVESCTAVPPCK